MIYIYDGGSLSVTEEEEKKKKDFYNSSIRLGYVYWSFCILCISAHFPTDSSTNHTFALPQSSLKSQREQNTHLDDRYETVYREV